MTFGSCTSPPIRNKACAERRNPFLISDSVPAQNLIFLSESIWGFEAVNGSVDFTKQSLESSTPKLMQALENKKRAGKRAIDKKKGIPANRRIRGSQGASVEEALIPYTSLMTIL
ncbi:hypothetical protein CCACVL1_23767 [Corchorus capsularis]|uniref:Uncharacterized protein n=1 Tax=Corchorus capsularis TaxID=210143 RepID=A0A1R3GSE2_COCAP|nr:hypothetical protein CCACVL1_23767 [Corchorus capsularis]